MPTLVSPTGAVTHRTLRRPRDVRPHTPCLGVDRYVRRLFRHSLAVSDGTQHAYQHGMESVRAFYVLGGQDMLEGARGKQDCTVLPATQAPMGTYQRLERCYVECDVFKTTVDVKIGRLRHHDGTAKHPGSMVAVRPERVDAGHLAGVESYTAVGTQRPGHPVGVEAGNETDTVMCT